MESAAVFLTGATGFVGARVAAELLRAGYAVTALSRGDRAVEGCRMVRGDLTDVRPFRRDIERADAIVHLASPRSAVRDIVMREEVGGSEAMIAAWRRGPFVYASSTSIHGVPQGILGQDAPLEPGNWYDVGKIATEAALRNASGRSGRGPAVILRAAIYAGGGARSMDGQIIGELIADCRAGRRFRFESQDALDTSGVSFVGIADFARAVVGALPLPAGGAYPIATGFIRWRDLIDLINDRVSPGATYSVGPGSGDDARLPQSRTEIDASAFVKASGWEPTDSIADLLDEALAQVPA